MCKSRMTEDSLAVTDATGKALGDRKPSSELAMHLLIYDERPDVMAVVTRIRRTAPPSRLRAWPSISRFFPKLS